MAESSRSLKICMWREKKNKEDRQQADVQCQGE